MLNIYVVFGSVELLSWFGTILLHNLLTNDGSSGVENTIFNKTTIVFF